MDIVQRKDVQKRLISANIWPMWTQFKASLNELLLSYEASDRVTGWHAHLKDVHERSIVITQNRGVAPHGFHNQMLSITASVRENESAALVLVIERYTERDGKHYSVKTQRSEYRIDADGETGEVYFARGEARMNPAEVAEKLVEDTILS